jgi:uncharacterized membrane protein YjgN (DUF898 family)
MLICRARFVAPRRSFFEARMTLAASAVSPTPGESIPRISWVHPAGGFVGLSLLNGVLRVLTVGVYHFWGKTEVRQRIWSAVRIDGEPLEYRGTGGELLRGFLIVFCLILLPMGLAQVAASLFLPATAQGIYTLAFWGMVFLLSGIGIHRARRYRLSRTRWRGIRGGLSGRSRGFAWTYLWTMLLVPLTLGWILPWRAVRLQRALFNDTRFGDNGFTFTGVAGPLYRRFWLVWVSGVILFIATAVAITAIIGFDMPRGGGNVPTMRTLGGWKIAAVVAVVLGALLIFAMIRAWYSSRMLNYFAAHTKLQGAGFTLRATAPSLVWLAASNYLLRLVSLGFLSAVTEARSMRYIVDRLSCDGAIAWSQIGQNPDALLKRGEGLAEAFDVDAF